MDIGGNIKLLRKEKEVTQMQVAEDLKISKAAIANYELNKRQPSPEMLVKMANYFGVTVDYLLDNEK